MSGGRTRETKTDAHGKSMKSVSVDSETYLVAKRMEVAGMLRPGQALMLAATLPNNTEPPKKGKRR